MLGRNLQSQLLFPAHGLDFVADEVPGSDQKPRQRIGSHGNCALSGKTEGVIGDLSGRLDIQDPAIRIPVDVLRMQSVQFLHI